MLERGAVSYTLILISHPLFYSVPQRPHLISQSPLNLVAGLCLHSPSPRPAPTGLFFLKRSHYLYKLLLRCTVELA